MSDEKRNLDEAYEAEGPIGKVDLAIVKAAQPYEDSLPVRALGPLSELADQPPLVTASLVTLGVGLIGPDSRVARAGARMLASHALATFVKTLIKDRIDRPRPQKVAEDGEHEVEEGTSEDGEDRSLPSGHSAGAVAVARAIVREAPGLAPLAYGAAGLAAGVQVPRKAHFPSDVVIGIGIGLAAEWLVDRAFRTMPDGD